MAKHRNYKKGYSSLTALLVTLIISIVGLTGYVVHSNQVKKENYTSKINSNVAPIRHLKIVKIPELGIQFTLPAGTLTGFKYIAKDVDYSQSGNNTLGIYPTAHLGTKQLDALGCSATGVMGNAPPLGFLTKTTGQYPAKPNAGNTTGTLLKQYPEFYISYRSRGLACFDDTAKNQVVTTANEQLQVALRSFELVK